MLTLVCCGAARDAIDCQSYFTKVGKTKLMPIPLEVPLLPPTPSLLLPPPPSRCCCALPKCKQTHTDSYRDWKLHVPPHCADSPQNSGSCCDFPPLSTPSGKWQVASSARWGFPSVVSSYASLSPSTCSVELLQQQCSAVRSESKLTWNQREYEITHTPRWPRRRQFEPCLCVKWNCNKQQQQEQQSEL